MSRRKREAARSTAVEPKSEAVSTKPTKEGEEHKWAKRMCIVTALGVLAVCSVPYITPLANHQSEEWYASKLTYRADEYVFKEGRVEQVWVKNEGNSVAKDVSLIVNCYMPGFQFPENQREHTHVDPDVPAELNISKNHLEVKLSRPLAPGQECALTIDKMPWTDTDKEYQIFRASVSSDRGQASCLKATFSLMPESSFNDILKKYIRNTKQ